MKKLILFLKILLVIAVIAAIAVILVIRNRDRVMKFAVEQSISWAMGARFTIGSFYLNVDEGKLKIENVRLYNPPGFSKAVLLDLPRADIHLELIPLKQGRFHFYHADIYLRQLLFEKDKAGKMNIDSLKIASLWLNNKSMPMPEFRIDRLDLRMGQVIEIDRQKEKEVVMAHDLNIHKKFDNISSVNQFILLLMVDPLKQAGIQGARVYGLSVLLGGPVAIPAAIAITSMGQGVVGKMVNDDIDTVYKATLKALDDMGDIKSKDVKNHIISASIQGADVVVIIRHRASKSNQIEVGASKFTFPQHEIASGVLYEIIEELELARRVPKNKREGV
jgi:hypothetical protein